MHIQLGKGDVEMGAVRLANGNWAVLLQKHAATHAIGEHANNVGEVYTPTERDVIIEIGKVESGRVLQDAVNHALLFASGLIKPTSQAEAECVWLRAELDRHLGTNPLLTGGR